MIRTLIADDNLHFVKGIINSILSKVPQIKVEYVTNDGKETLNILEKKKFDLVLLDLCLPDMNGIEVLRRFNTINFVKVPKVVIITGDMSLVAKLRKYPNVYNVILKTEDEEVITRKIIQISREINYEANAEAVKEKVTSEITKLGYSIKYVGTKYLIESIIFIYEHNNYDLVNNLENNVYRIIASRHAKSTENVKNNISKSALIRGVMCSPKYAISDILTRIM